MSKMTASEDTEITLGTGKILGLFFGLVVLCAIFLGIGFTLGRNSVKTAAEEPQTVTPAANSARRPSAADEASQPAPQPPDMTFYKSVGQSQADATIPSSPPAPAAAVPDANSSSSESNPAPPLNGYYVQVAAVTKQDDADVLVEALKKKQYPAVAAPAASDKLIHVEVGPFSAIKDAESMRAQLLSDGYNPIVKK